MDPARPSHVTQPRAECDLAEARLMVFMRGSAGAALGLWVFRLDDDGDVQQGFWDFRQRVGGAVDRVADKGTTLTFCAK
ncbi:unnamed protein product [Boreogadus saida]